MVKKYLNYEGLDTLVSLIKQEFSIVESAIGKDENNNLIAVTDRIKNEAEYGDYKEKNISIYTFTKDDKTFIITSKDILTGKTSSDITSLDETTTLDTLYPNKTLREILEIVDSDKTSGVTLYSIKDELDELEEIDSFAISKVEKINDNSYHIEASNNSEAISSNWAVSKDSSGNTIWTLNNGEQVISMIGFEDSSTGDIWVRGTGNNSSILANTNSTASGNNAICAGNTVSASGSNAMAIGNHTIAQGNNQFVSGKYNVADTQSKYAYIIGGGTKNTARKNIFTIAWNGDVATIGDIKIVDKNNTTIASLLEINNGDNIKIVDNVNNILIKNSNNELYVEGYTGSDSINISNNVISAILSSDTSNILEIKNDGLYAGCLELEDSNIDWDIYKESAKQYNWGEMLVFNYGQVDGYPWKHFEGSV